MFKSFYQSLTVAIIAVSLICCSGENNKPGIKFSVDSSSIVIKNINKASLLKVKDAYSSNPDVHQLVTVLLKPGELDSLQDETVVVGKINFKGDSIVFTPDEPFIRGRDYLVESYIEAEFATAEKLILGKVKQNLQPQRQTLKR